MRAVLSRLKGARGRAIVVAATALVAGGSAAGCDTQEDADLERGRELFVENCGTCHALTEARQTATVGPDLDASFAAARATGMDQDTIEGVVQSQIENPRTINEDNPYYDRTFMPADIVTGQDAEDVAAYVASVAGVPGIEPPALGTPEEVFVRAVRRLPHAGGRRHCRDHRPRPRRGACPARAPSRSRSRSGTPRRGSHPASRAGVMPAVRRERDPGGEPPGVWWTTCWSPSAGAAGGGSP